MNIHIREKLAKVDKGLGIIRWLNNNILPRQSLITVYKSFVRSRLDYCEIIYDQPNSQIFCNLVEKVRLSCSPTARKESKCGVISGLYFSVFGLNTGTYGPEITPYLDSFQAECLTITGTIKGTSQLKLYKEFSWESLRFRRWLTISVNSFSWSFLQHSYLWSR